MVKPINLPQCYLAAWPSAEANDRAGVDCLNQGVDDIVRGFELNVGVPFWWERFTPRPGQRRARRPHRKQFGYMGSMHSRYRAFVGLQWEERDTLAQQQVITAILTDQTVEKLMGLWQPDWLGQSVEELAAVPGQTNEDGAMMPPKAQGAAQ